jgi:hypothetical protein
MIGRKFVTKITLDWEDMVVPQLIWRFKSTNQKPFKELRYFNYFLMVLIDLKNNWGKVKYFRDLKKKYKINEKSRE